MSAGTLFIFLHIFTMFMAVALSVGLGLVLHRVAATENVIAIRTVFGAAQPIGKVTPMVYGIGFLFGIIAAIIASFNLLAPWLLMAYILFVVALVMGTRTGKWAASVGRAAATNQGDVPAAELKQLLHDKSAVQVTYATVVVIALIVALMVFKPFGV